MASILNFCPYIGEMSKQHKIVKISFGEITVDKNT